MPFGLRPTVNSVVLGCRDDLEVSRIVALKPFHESHAHPSSEVGIFTVGFLSPPPARVSEDVNVGRPEGQPCVYAPVALPDRFMVLGAGFLRDHCCHPVHEIDTPGCGQANSLRKDRRNPGSRYAVQALVPPVMLGDVQSLDGRSIVHHLRDLLLQRHPGNQVLQTRFNR